MFYRTYIFSRLFERLFNRALLFRETFCYVLFFYLREMRVKWDTRLPDTRFTHIPATIVRYKFFFLFFQSTSSKIRRKPSVLRIPMRFYTGRVIATEKTAVSKFSCVLSPTMKRSLRPWRGEATARPRFIISYCIAALGR